MAINCNAVTAKKKLPSLLSSQQHFAGIFGSEPMTLPEMDHVSFLVELAQTFFAGEGLGGYQLGRMRKSCLDGHSRGDHNIRLRKIMHLIITIAKFSILIGYQLSTFLHYRSV